MDSLENRLRPVVGVILCQGQRQTYQRVHMSTFHRMGALALLLGTLSAFSACKDPGDGPAAHRLSPSPGVERSAIDPDAPLVGLAAGFNDAGFELMRTQGLADNLVFSPASIGHALLMARAAADQPTGEAIDDAFSLPAGMSAHTAWNAIDRHLDELAVMEDELTITFADRIWPRIDIMPEQSFVDLLASEHGADVLPLDFAGDPDGSRDVINDWISGETQGLIPQLLPAGFIKSQTVLVLTDAIYFKARWRTVFGKYGTVTDDFLRLDGSTVEVDYLHELELGGPRGMGEGFVGAEIPYVGEGLSMLLIVPDTDRFDEVRQRLGQDLLDEIDETFTMGSLELLMPPWQTTSHIDLLTWLTDIGAAPGRYPAITPSAFLGGAVHGADITVDEWGTVAAAATALSFDESGVGEPEFILKASRPFLYVVRHRDSGLILFAGQVTDPT